MEYVEIQERLEQKRRAKIRRHQRDLKQQLHQLEQLEKARVKQEKQRLLMQQEDELSREIEHWFRQQAYRQRLELQRQKQMQLFQQVAEVRKQSKLLGVDLSTPGLAGKARKTELEQRIQAKQNAQSRMQQAKKHIQEKIVQKLRDQRLLRGLFPCQLTEKVESAVAQQHCETLLELLQSHMRHPTNQLISKLDATATAAAGTVTTPSSGSETAKPTSSSQKAAAAIANYESLNGLTPLIGAIYRRQHLILRRLCQLGANVNQPTRHGMTPLIAAILTNDLVALGILLDSHVDVEQETRFGVKPLLIAAEKGRQQVVETLLGRANAQVNAANAKGRTALMQAVVANQFDVFRVLLAARADRDLRDREQKTALVLAQELELVHMVTLLKSSLSCETIRVLLDQEQKLELGGGATQQSPSPPDQSAPSQEEPGQARRRSSAEEVPHAQRFERRKHVHLLLEALAQRDVAMVCELLEVDNSLSANFEDDHGQTPLLLSCLVGTIEQVALCLRHHGIVKHSNRFGINALMSASHLGQMDVLQMLMETSEEGAGLLLATDFNGWNTYRHLQQQDQHQVIEWLTHQYRHGELVKTGGSTGASSTNQSVPPISLTWSSLHKPPLLGEAIKSTAESKCEREPTKENDTMGEAEVKANDSACLKDAGEEVEVAEEAQEEWEDDDEFGVEEHVKLHNWQSRRRGFKHLSSKRRERFNQERVRILAALQRGRRNGILTPVCLISHQLQQHQQHQQQHEDGDDINLWKGQRLIHHKFAHLCANCHSQRARKKCFECNELQCDKCHANLHLLATKRHHQHQELRPELFVGNTRFDLAVQQEEARLGIHVVRSQEALNAMKRVLEGDQWTQLQLHRDLHPSGSASEPSLLTGHDPAQPKICSPVDLEVEAFVRKERAIKERLVMQKEINVPVEAAKHAAKRNEDAAFSAPAELELAELYLVQKKFDQALECLHTSRQVVEKSYGITHPTLLKIALCIGKLMMAWAKPQECLQVVGDAIETFEEVVGIDQVDLLACCRLQLDALEAQQQFEPAVKFCCHLQSLVEDQINRRMKCSIDPESRPATPWTLQQSAVARQIATWHSACIGRYESVWMAKEDLVALQQQSFSQEAQARRQEEDRKRRRLFDLLLFDDDDALQQLLVFVKPELLEEMVFFWIDVSHFKQLDRLQPEFRSTAVRIYMDYIKKRRLKMVTAVQRKKIRKTITTPGKKLPIALFDDIGNVVFDVLFENVFPRFLASEFGRKWHTKMLPTLVQKPVSPRQPEQVRRNDDEPTGDRRGDYEKEPIPMPGSPTPKQAIDPMDPAKDQPPQTPQPVTK